MGRMHPFRKKRYLARARSQLRRVSLERLIPTLLLYGSGLIRSGFGFLIGIMIARVFGVEDYGLFYTYMLAVTLSLALFGESLDGGVIRFYTYRLNHEPDRASEVLGSALVLRALVAVPVLAAGLGFVQFIAPNWLADPSIGYLVLAGLFGGLSAGLVSFVCTIFICQEKYIARAALQPAMNAVRCLCLGLGVLVGLRSLDTVLWIDVAAMSVFALSALWYVRRDLTNISFSQKMIAELARFAGWSVTGMVSVLLVMGLSAPLLIHYWGPREAGIFGAAMSFAVVLEHAAGAIISVQHQGAAKLKHRNEFVQFLKRTALVSMTFVLMLAPIGLFAGPLIPFIFGADFAASADLFPIVFLATIVHILTTPFGLIFVSLSKPERMSLGPILAFPVWLFFALWLIPQYAELGAVLSVLCGRLAQGLITLALVWHTLSGHGQNEQVQA